jgi:hypothetical protein
LNGAFFEDLSAKATFLGVHKFLSGGDFIRYIWLIVSLIPMPFLFHYYEISRFLNRATFLFTETLFFVVFTGLLSIKIKLHFIILVNIIIILVSVVLGTEFKIPPNDSWFNPFGMNFAIIFAGIVILIGVLIIRFVSKSI